MQDTVAKIFDRRDPAVRAYQDLTFNVALFAAAVFLINRYGHKLAV